MRRLTWRVRESKSDWGLLPVRPGSEIADAVAESVQAMADPVRAAFSRARLTRLLRQLPGPPMISLGSGTTVPDGWWGLDFRRRGPRIFYADLRRPLPLPDASVGGLLAEHVVEHLHFDDIPQLLCECRRVLRRGAPIRIVSPDARKIARLILDPGSSEAQTLVADDHLVHHWPASATGAMRTANRLSHQWGQHASLVNAALIIDLLTVAGFASASECPPGTTAFFPSLPDRHPERFPQSTEAFAVEALA